MTIYGVLDKDGRILGYFRDSQTAAKLQQSRSGLTLEPFEVKDRVDQCDELKSINALSHYRCVRPLGHDPEHEFKIPAPKANAKPVR